MAITFGLALIGNAAAVAVILLNRRRLTRTTFFVLHISVAGLVVAFLDVLPQLIWDITHRFQGDDFACKSVKFLQVFSLYLSVWTLVMMASDRYFEFSRPIEKAHVWWVRRRRSILIGIAWLLASLFSLPQLFVFFHQEVMPGVHDCWATFVVEWGSKAHVSWFAVSIFIIPTSILTATFARAIWTGLKLHRHDANAGSLQPDDSASLEGRSHTNLTQDPQEYVGHSYSELSPGIARRLNIRNKLLREKLIAAFIVCYICCWTPFISLLLYTTFHPTRRVNVSTFNILTFLTKLHICANPWIYLVFVVVKIGRYARGGSGRNWMGTLEEQDLVTSSGLNTEMDLQEPRTGRVWHREEFGRG